VNYSNAEIWTVILGMAAGTYLIRFSFLGLHGHLKMPLWALRLLRYTPVAVIPGLVAPMVLWPAATGGEPDLARVGAALVALAVGVYFKNVLAAMTGGAVTLYLMLFLLG
jgi:branched chain amino acid efflux pump